MTSAWPILIQVVQGEQFGRYFLPVGAGVAFSRNLYRWAPQIRREDGFARLVWGLGTRAVERGGIITRAGRPEPSHPAPG